MTFGRTTIGTEAYERIKIATGLQTQVELAELLGIRQSSISDVCRRRCKIPDSWLITIWRKTKINPDWIETGQGKKFLVEADEFGF
jgi:hypothetical protein